MSNGHKLLGSGSNQSHPEIFPRETGSSDSASALTVENVKRLENEYKTSKEAFTKQRIQDYIKQTNMACFNKETTRKTSTELVQNAEPGPSSSFLAKKSKNSKGVCWKTSEEISRKDKLLTVPTTDSPSDQTTGSKRKESKWCVGGYPVDRMHDVKEEMTQTKWSYSNESLDAKEEVIGEEKKISETVGGRSSLEPTEEQVMEVLSRESDVFPKAGESKERVEDKEEAAAEDGEENNQAGLCKQAAWEPVELAQGSPKPESDEELLSTGEEHKDDGTATLLCSGKVTTWTEESAKCTFCSAPEKPIPTVMDLKEQPQENFFCCRTYKEMFDDIIQNLMSEDEAEEEELDITLHVDPFQANLKNAIKEKLLQQLDEEDFESYSKILQQYMKLVASTRISFRLSKQTKYSVRPKLTPFQKYQSAAAHPEDLLELDSEFVAAHLKHCHSPEPVRRHYPDGQTFFLLFPDGSGQVYYPSGNMAILITFSEEALFIYYILEDSRYPGIRAAFGSHGHGVCFHPDGHIWAALNPYTGIFLDQERASQKSWSWHDFSHHTHSPPFQSITMKFNSHITIKILAQDQIDLSFTSHSDCIHFNVGSRLKLKDPEASHLLHGPESEEEHFLQTKKIHFRSLLSKIQRALKCFWQPPSQ